jgi:hypothetical protein
LTVIIVAMALSGVLLLSLFEQYFLQATENSLAAQAQITAQAILPDSNAEGQVMNPTPKGGGLSLALQLLLRWKKRWSQVYPRR